MAKNPLKITSTTLRDAHQSLLATRMHTDDMIDVCESIDKVGYFSVEMWGGATFDSCIRFTGENPWERITTLKKYIKKTPFQMLLRGQNCVGYRHYADDLVGAFIDHAADRGIDIFRIFDALNDPRNVEFATNRVKKKNKTAEGCICYTTSPVHTIDTYVKLAQQLKDMGSDLICIKDMAGLLDPIKAFELTKRLKEEVKLPVHLHTHSTTGFSVATYLKAAEAGVDIIDCAISTLSMGTSQPAVETFVAMFEGTDRDTGFDTKLLKTIAAHIDEVRKENYQSYETGFSGVDARVLTAQVPGGMLSNLNNQLKEMNALDKYNEVMEEIPRVREDFGFPPLVTPSSQIVGVQAVMNVISGERYKVIPEESKLYLKGMYGRPPADVNEEIRKKALGDEKVIDSRPADLLEPEFPKIDKENIKYLKNVEDKIIYAMFPKASMPFFEAREKGELHKFKEKLHTKPVAHKQKDSESIIDSNIYKYNVKVEGQTFEVLVSEGEIKAEAKTQKSAKKTQQKPQASGGKITGEQIDIKSELPGVVIDVLVNQGQQVRAGEKILVIEAMKMMNDITAPIDGIVSSVNVSANDKIEIGTVMVSISQTQ